MNAVVKDIDRNKAAAFLMWTMLLGFMVLLLRTAWICDDSYITLRTIDNFVNGYGLRWNVAERVQSYTHPLWLFLITIFYYFTREAYFTTIILSIVVTMAALLVYVRWVAASNVMAMLGLMVFALSRAYMDFSTSGLENPLSHLLIFIFLAVYLRHEGSWGKREIFLLSLIASLGVLNRMDTALIYAPPMLYALITRRDLRLYLYALLGTVPFLAWEAFSLFYYGFLFPNTAYAKLNHGIDRIILLRHGIDYFKESLWVDPLTLLAVAGGMVMAVASRKVAHVSIAVGVLLYLLYVALIGGDFMSGRFFTITLVAAVALLTAHRLEQQGNDRKMLAGAFAIVLVLGMLAYYPTVLTGPRYGLERGKLVLGEGFSKRLYSWETPMPFLFKEGIADERAYYYQFTGMFRDSEINGNMGVEHAWASIGRAIFEEGITVQSLESTGFAGYYAGPQVYLIDEYALSDPLLARLPAMDKEDARVGHYTRAIPLGYPESISQDMNLIEDKALAIFYDDLKLATRDPLVSNDRLKAIWRLNTTDYGLPTDSSQYKADLRIIISIQ